jgi:hypothetical protein
MAALVVVGALFAASAGAAFGTWTSSTNDSTAFTSGAALQTPTGVSASFYDCAGGTAWIQINFTVPGGSGGNAVYAYWATSVGGPYTNMSFVTLPASSGVWQSPLHVQANVYVEVATGYNGQSFYSTPSTAVNIGATNC